MIHKVLVYPNTKLKDVSVAVSTFSGDLQGLVVNLFDTMRAYRGAGLSAIQIGVALRVVVLEGLPGLGQGNPGSPLALINPVIASLSEEKKIMTEGCLSFPGIFEKVERSLKATVEGLDTQGRPRTLSLEGLQAHAIQHEVEHLEGMLLSDRMSRARRGLVMGELKKFKR